MARSSLRISWLLALCFAAVTVTSYILTDYTQSSQVQGLPFDYDKYGNCLEHLTSSDLLKICHGQVGSVPSSVVPDSCRDEKGGFNEDIVRDIRMGKYWSEVSSQLDFLINCPNLLQQTRSFQLHVPRWDNIPMGQLAKRFPEYGAQERWFFNEAGRFKFNETGFDPPPAAHIPHLLATTLQEITDLESVRWEMHEKHATVFQAAFREVNLSLPSAVTLATGYSYVFLVDHCPNIQSVSAIGRSHGEESVLEGARHASSLAFLKAAGEASKLSSIEITEIWDKELVDALIVMFPNITTLKMRGGFDRWYTPGDSSLETAATSLGQHKNLKHLTLPDAFCLDVTNYQPPFCGNVYDGPDGGASVREGVDREYKKAEEKAVRIIDAALPRLQTLTIGDDVVMSRTVES